MNTFQRDRKTYPQTALIGLLVCSLSAVALACGNGPGQRFRNAAIKRAAKRLAQGAQWA